MKKFILGVAMLATVAFVSCSDDDDNGTSSCTTCSLDAGIATVTSKYCDNGDGTMTVTNNGESETVDLEGQSFDSVISALKQGGATCD